MIRRPPRVWYGLSVRFWCVLIAAALASITLADDLIDIPTARKILFEDFRYEFRSEPSSGGSYQNFLGLGVGPAFELDLRQSDATGGHPIGTFDFAYNYIAAIPGITPGVSFGVQDSANETPEGRRYYMVTTYRTPVDEIPGNVTTDITLGFQFGSLTSPFVGVSLPFSQHLFLVAEDSGFRISAGAELRFSRTIFMRLIERGNQTLLSLSATAKF